MVHKLAARYFAKDSALSHFPKALRSCKPARHTRMTNGQYGSLCHQAEHRLLFLVCMHNVLTTWNKLCDAFLLILHFLLHLLPVPSIIFRTTTSLVLTCLEMLVSSRTNHSKEFHSVWLCDDAYVLHSHGMIASHPRCK